MNEHSIITNFYKQFVQKDADKSKILKALLTHVMESNPGQKDYIMLNKVIRDFGHDIVFDALVALRYSNGSDQNPWGYIIAVCKNLLKELAQENPEDSLSAKTDLLLSSLKTRMTDARTM